MKEAQAAFIFSLVAVFGLFTVIVLSIIETPPKAKGNNWEVYQDSIASCYKHKDVETIICIKKGER